MNETVNALIAVATDAEKLLRIVTHSLDYTNHTSWLAKMYEKAGLTRNVESRLKEALMNLTSQESDVTNVTPAGCRLLDKDSLQIAFDVLENELPVQSEILVFADGYRWRQDRECFCPDTNGKLISVSKTVDNSIFAFSAASLTL
mgnify:CR=1 FL=1